MKDLTQTKENIKSKKREVNRCKEENKKQRKNISKTFSRQV